MTEAVGHEGNGVVQVVIGVDTHQDQHVAVAIDQLGLRQAAHAILNALGTLALCQMPGLLANNHHRCQPGKAVYPACSPDTHTCRRALRS